MDSLELLLRLEKIDPALVPDSSVRHKDETYQKMSSDWTEVDNKAKQLITDATDVSHSSILHSFTDSLTFSRFHSLVSYHHFSSVFGTFLFQLHTVSFFNCTMCIFVCYQR